MRSVFYGVLLTVFFVCAGSVQAANDEYERGISGEGPGIPGPSPEDLFGDEVFLGELEDGTRIADPNVVRRVEEEERREQDRQARGREKLRSWLEFRLGYEIRTWDERVGYAEVAVRTLLGPQGKDMFCKRR